MTAAQARRQADDLARAAARAEREARAAQGRLEELGLGFEAVQVRACLLAWLGSAEGPVVVLGLPSNVASQPTTSSLAWLLPWRAAPHPAAGSSL